MADRSAQTVLTTGVNSGIGLATVMELARRGFRSVGSVRSEAKAQLVAPLPGRGAGCFRRRPWLSRPGRGAEGADVVRSLRPSVGGRGQCWLRVDRGRRGRWGRRGPPDLRDHVHAPMRLAREALPGLRAQRGRNAPEHLVDCRADDGSVRRPLHRGEARPGGAVGRVADGDGPAKVLKVVLVEPGGFKTGICDEFEPLVEPHGVAGTRHGGSYRRSLQAQRWPAAARWGAQTDAPR